MSVAYTYEGILDTKTSVWPTVFLPAGDLPYNHWSSNKPIGSYVDKDTGLSIQVIVLYNSGTTNYNQYDSRYILLPSPNPNNVAIVIDAIHSADYMANYPTADGNNAFGFAHWLDDDDVYFVISHLSSTAFPATRPPYMDYIFKFSLKGIDFSSSQYLQVFPNYVRNMMGYTEDPVTHISTIQPAYRTNVSYFNGGGTLYLPSSYPDMFSQLSFLDDNGHLTAPYYNADFGLMPFSCRGMRNGLIGPGNLVSEDLSGGVVQNLVTIYNTFKNAWTTFFNFPNTGPPWYTFCQIMTGMQSLSDYSYLYPSGGMDFSVDQNINRIYSVTPTSVNLPRLYNSQLVSSSPIINADYCMMGSQTSSDYTFATWSLWNQVGFTVKQMVANYQGINYNALRYSACDASNGYMYCYSNLIADNGSTQIFLPGTNAYYIYRYDMVNQKFWALPMHTSGLDTGSNINDFIITKNNSMLMYQFNSFSSPSQIRIIEMILPLTLDIPFSITHPVHATDIRTFF